MSDFISGALIPTGNNYTVGANGDFLIWLPFGYSVGANTTLTQSFGGVALTEQQDESTDIAGNGDPVIALGYLSSPALTAQALVATWSSNPVLTSGYAFSFQNVDIAAPIRPGVNGSDSATYGATNTPALTYSAVAGDTVFYYKYHCTNGSSTLALPTGFTLIDNTVLLTTPAYRQVSYYYKKITVDETLVSIGADTSGSSAVGGAHGFVVLKLAEAPTGVNIGTVDTDNVVEIGQTLINTPGSGYEAVQGTGTVIISPTDNIADANAVTLTATSWADELIEFTIPTSLSMLYGTVYLFITNNTGEVNAAGKSLSLVPPVLNDYLVIREQNDLGILKDIVGLALEADQLEYQKLSANGGTVYMGVSGTYYIYDYPANAVTSTDTILFRLGDASDGTWSSIGLTNFSVGAAANISGTINQTMNGFTQVAVGTVVVGGVTGTISQNMNSYSQNATGTVAQNSITGVIAQIMSGFTQAAVGGLTGHDVTATITQTMTGFSQVAIGTLGIAPAITQPPHATIAKNSTFNYTPSLASGADVLWFKEYGPDDLIVDPETGAITWDTTSLPRGQGVRITLGCSNFVGEDLKTFVVHVDELGTSKLMLMNGAVDVAGGTPTTVATTIRAAATEINSGDTLIIPDGSFFASIVSQNSGENTWDEQNLNDLPTGLSNQHTSVMSEGYTIIDAAPHDSIARDDKGLQSGPTNTGEFYKFSGIEWTGSNRGPVVFRSNGAVLDFCGGTDGSYAVTPTTQVEADAAFANIAGTYIGGNCLAENCFGFGDARYIFQAGNRVTSSSFNRCIARPDEYNGTNPRGGIIHYAVDQSGTFSSFVIDGDQEHLSPFYNNYAGAFGMPATGNETWAQFQLMRGCASINVDMNSILNDSNSATNLLTIEDFLLLDTTNTVTPWTHATSLMGIQSDSQMTVSRLSMSETHRWDFDATTGANFFGASTGSVINGAIFDRLGWDGVSATIDIADLVGSDTTVDNANIYDFKGSIDALGSSTPTTTVTLTNPKDNGWDYPVRAESGSPIAIAGQAADLTRFAAPSSLLPTDTGWDTATNEWAWPHPEEQHIAARMRTYSKTGMAVRNPTASTNPVDLTGTITGNRGFAATGESFSEYIWGQFGRTVPPLRVAATTTGTGEVTLRVGRYRSTRGDTITKFNVYETSDLINPVGSVTGGLKVVLSGVAGGAHTYIIKAVDASQLSAWGANETGESGPSREMTVTVSALAGPAGGISQTMSGFTQVATGTVAPQAPIDGTITQTMNQFSQSATGVLAASLVVGTINQTMSSFVQVAVGGLTQSGMNGTIALTMNGFTQDANGTITKNNINGTISQTMKPFSQQLIERVPDTIRQTMNNFSQSMSGVITTVNIGTITQTMNSFETSMIGSIYTPPEIPVLTTINKNSILTAINK